MSGRGVRRYLELFLDDAARWVRPEQVAGRDELRPARVLKLLLHHPPLRAMAWLRLGSLARARRVPFLTGWCMRRLLRLYGLEISPGDHVGGGLYVPHTSGTIISVDEVGRNVTIMGGSTFGMRGSHLFPRIGDGVYVGAGARVLGDVTLGDGAVVGANAVVLVDVPPGATAVGVPAVVRERAAAPTAPATGTGS